jgi:hypothetical protein
VLTGRSPQDIVGEYPVVSLASLLDVDTASVTPEGFGYDPAGGELWFVGETAEAVLLELHGRRSALRAETAELEALLADASRLAGETAERARATEEAYGRAPRLRASTLDPRVHSRLVDLTARLGDVVGAAQATARRFEAPLRARVDAGATRAGELGEELRTLGATEVSLRQELDEASGALTAAEVEIARIDAETSDATRRLE